MLSVDAHTVESCSANGSRRRNNGSHKDHSNTINNNNCKSQIASPTKLKSYE